MHLCINNIDDLRKACFINLFIQKEKRYFSD